MPDGTFVDDERPAVVSTITMGMSTAPEPHGDPYSLRFERDEQHQPTAVIGDPMTNFYLRGANECLGPFSTDAQGNWSDPAILSSGSFYRLVSFCDSEETIDGFWPVPAMSNKSLFLLIFALLSLGLLLLVKSQKRKMT